MSTPRRAARARDVTRARRGGASRAGWGRIVGVGAYSLDVGVGPVREGAAQQ